MCVLRWSPWWIFFIIPIPSLWCVLSWLDFYWWYCQHFISLFVVVFWCLPPISSDAFFPLWRNIGVGIMFHVHSNFVLGFVNRVNHDSELENVVMLHVHTNHSSHIISLQANPMDLPIWELPIFILTTIVWQYAGVTVWKTIYLPTSRISSQTVYVRGTRQVYSVFALHLKLMSVTLFVSLTWSWSWYGSISVTNKVNNKPPY